MYQSSAFYDNFEISVYNNHTTHMAPTGQPLDRFCSSSNLIPNFAQYVILPWDSLTHKTQNLHSYVEMNERKISGFACSHIAILC